jgi:hypothetical protein
VHSTTAFFHSEADKSFTTFPVCTKTAFKRLISYIHMPQMHMVHISACCAGIGTQLRHQLNCAAFYWNYRGIWQNMAIVSVNTRAFKYTPGGIFPLKSASETAVQTSCNKCAAGQR